MGPPKNGGGGPTPGTARHTTYETSRDQTAGRSDTTRPQWPWPQGAHADLGLVDDADTAGGDA